MGVDSVGFLNRAFLQCTYLSPATTITPPLFCPSRALM